MEVVLQGGNEVLCPSCKHENRAGRKFCVHCGTGLGRVCPSCGARTETEERFCGECGNPLADAANPAPLSEAGAHTSKYRDEKILATRSALEGERKQITVLFADVKESTALIAYRDPEDAQRLLDPILERMSEA